MRAYRHGRGFALRTWESGGVAPPEISRPFILDQLSRLRHRVQMFSPFPLQRFNSLCTYYWRRGFQEEWAKRRALARKEAVFAGTGIDKADFTLLASAVSADRDLGFLLAELFR